VDGKSREGFHIDMIKHERKGGEGKKVGSSSAHAMHAQQIGDSGRLVAKPGEESHGVG
jgi:hypothetical protein